MTDILATLDGLFQSLVRAHAWTPVETVVALLAGSVSLSIVAAFVADWIVDGLAAVRRWRCRREVRRGFQGGLSRYADPGRMHRETAHHVQRLAARPPAADAGADRRVDADGVGDAAGVHGDRAGRPAAGRGHLGARGPAVSRPASGLARDRRAGGYGAGTTLVFPPVAPKRVNGHGRVR
ncbi:MAG: hypothetical protein A3J29_06315 [Acidobacteria bacterium RIFCSPLOWO2_12_FULL_67_14b]|nr:MAG: hypothetical protein A3J29_06315 [Acidobacteria bacterium RIFCSPLOWO2_12_FULL_67_14b]